jgi:hypothetical protein
VTLERVRVLGLDYRLESKTRITSGGAAQRGLCNPHRQTISILEGITPDQHGEVLLHEVLHAIEDGMGFDCDEATVRGFGRGLWAVVKDNPGFLELLATLAKG